MLPLESRCPLAFGNAPNGAEQDEMSLKALPKEQI